MATLAAFNRCVQPFLRLFPYCSKLKLLQNIVKEFFNQKISIVSFHCCSTRFFLSKAQQQPSCELSTVLQLSIGSPRTEPAFLFVCLFLCSLPTLSFVARLDMNLEIPGAASQSLATTTASTEQDELSQRLARLRET